MAQKTFEEILSESTELKLTDKFKDKIFEFSNDVNAMGIVVNIREDGNSKFFFKDQKHTKPVTDNELLAMYLDEVVPTRLVDDNKSLERIRDLKSEKLKFLEYKADDITKKFYKIGNYFSGETYISFHDLSEEEKPVITLFAGRPSGYSANVGNFIRYELLAEDLAELLNYNNVTLSQEGRGEAKLPIHVETVDEVQIAYAGGDAYPPTSLIDPPSMMVYYTSMSTETEAGDPAAYVLFEKPSGGLWQIPNIGIAVDPNDRRSE